MNFAEKERQQEIKSGLPVKLSECAKFIVMKLIVGLGNPGKEYENTRHNIGFLIVEALQKNLQFEPFHEEKKFKAALSTGVIHNEKVVLVKPLTFMNNSGQALHALLQFYKVTPENLLVIYDELDLVFGAIRIRKKGSAGTHNGMKSIVASLGTDHFARLRFGIESRGFTAPEKQETVSFVLDSFTNEEQEQLSLLTQKATQAVQTYLEEGIDAAMNRFNEKSHL
jgi:PTH1 family peptidyl-tRNA hydrolase